MQDTVDIPGFGWINENFFNVNARRKQVTGGDVESNMLEAK
jgi:hypothetical protein